MPSSATGTADQQVALDAVVIGAGFSGLYQLFRLRDRLGLKVKVLEAADGDRAQHGGMDRLHKLWAFAQETMAKSRSVTELHHAWATRWSKR